MGIIQSFERRLQGAVGNTFARLFGGSVHPSEVITALQNEASGKLERQGGRVIAPNHFTVRLGPTDRQGLGEDEQRVARALSDTIREYLHEQGWETFGDVEVELAEAPSLHTGQFRISAIKDPDAGRARRAPSAGSASRQPYRPYPNVQFGGGPGGAIGPAARQGRRDSAPDVGRYGPGASDRYGHHGYQADAGPVGSDSADQHGPYEVRDPSADFADQTPSEDYQDPGYSARSHDDQSHRDQGYGDQSYGDHHSEPRYLDEPYSEPGYSQRQAYPVHESDRPQAAHDRGYQTDRSPRSTVAALHAEDGSGRSFRLQRGSNVVGRGQEAAFRLPDTSVSRRHVDIYFDGVVAVLHDLGSTNGTTVNGAGVQTWQLADGDVIRLGHSTISFTQEG